MVTFLEENHGREVSIEMKENISAEIEKYKKMGLFKKPKNRLLNFLDLKDKEELLINLRLFPLRSVFINSVRERYPMHLILTTERIIFMLNRGWLLKEFLPYGAITEILITRKGVSSSDFPVIMIKTLSDTYEILFTTFFPYRKKINGIVDCIKNRSPDTNVRIDSKYHDDEDVISVIRNSFKDLLLIKIKFK